MQKDIKKNAKIVDRFLKKYFTNQKYSNLLPAMKYGVLFGGKKIRSILISYSIKVFQLLKYLFFSFYEGILEHSILEHRIFYEGIL